MSTPMARRAVLPPSDEPPSVPEPMARMRAEIKQVEPLVQTLKISCASPCVLALGMRSVPGEANTRWTVYLDPGKVTLAASFFGGASAQQEVNAVAGASRELRFEPQEAPSKKPATPAVVTPAPAKSAAPEKRELPPADPPEAPPDQPPSKGLHPAFFFAGLAATALFTLAVYLFAANNGMPMGFPAPWVIGVSILLIVISCLSGVFALGILKKSQPADLLR